MKVKPSKTVIVGLVAFAAFAVVLAAIEFVLYRGLIAFGEHYMHLHGGQRAAMYVALQGGTLATAALGLWSVLVRDSYAMHRIWTGIFLAAAVVASYLGARAAGWPTTGALFAAGFAVAALRTWHAILKRIARNLSPKTPALRYPVLRWVLAFKETSRAFKVSYLDSLTPAEALARVRGELAPPPELLTADGLDVRKLSKSEAIEAAYSAIGSYDVGTAATWLAERGVTANRSTFYDVRDRLTTQRRAELHAVTSAKAIPAAPAATDETSPAAPAKRTPARKAAVKKTPPTASDATPAITVRQVG